MAVTNVGQPVAAIKAAASSGSFAAFSPVAGHGYVVVTSLGTNQSGAAASTVAWASSGNGTWTKLASFNFNQFQPTTEIWYVHVTTAPGSSTVSVTGNAFVTSVYASVSEISGHAITQSGGATASSVSSPFNTLSVTPNTTGGLLFYGARDSNEGFTVTPNAASTALDSWNNGGAEHYSLVSSATTAASSPVTLGVTNTLTANSQLALEIVPAAGGGPVALAGAAQAADSAKGSLAAARPLTAKSTAADSAKALVSVTRPVTGKVTAAGSAKASVNVARPFAARAAAASSARADLTVAGPSVVALAGVAAAAAAARGSLNRARPLAGAAAAACGARGTLSTNVPVIVPVSEFSEFWVHTGAVEPYLGTTGNGVRTYGPKVTVPGFVERKRTLVRNAAAEQVLSQTQFYGDPSLAVYFPPESRVTLDDGVTTVITRSLFTSGDIDLPDHVAVYLQ